MKPVVLSDKERWDWMSRKINNRRFLRKFWTISTLMLWCYEENQRFFSSTFLYKCYFLNWVQDGGIRTCIAWGIQVWKRSEKKNVAFLENVGLSRHWGQKHKSTILKSKSSLRLNFFDAEPDRIDKAHSSGERWVWIPRKLNRKFFQWKFRTIRLLMQENKTKIFWLNARLQALCSRSKLRWNKLEWWWPRKNSLKNGRNQNK